MKTADAPDRAGDAAGRVDLEIAVRVARPAVGGLRPGHLGRKIPKRQVGVREGVRGVVPSATERKRRTDVTAAIAVLTADGVVGAAVQVLHELVDGRLVAARERGASVP